MTSERDPVLVVCHEATRTGGVRALLDVLSAAKAQVPAPVAVRLLAGGPLADRLLALADVPDHGRVSAVVVNSALALDAVAAMGLRAPVLAWIHEEGGALAGLADRALRTLRDNTVQRVLAVSRASRDALVHLGVDPERVGVLPPVVTPPDAPPAEVIRVRSELLGANGRSLVVGCGEASWRKGTDLFLDLARRHAGRPEVRWAWIGRRPRGFARQLDHDARAMGLDVLWTSELPDVGAHLAAADLLVMTSREDPQPLVPLESALVGTPTAAFHIGGLAELGDDGAADTVPFPDTAALDRVVGTLLEDQGRRQRLVAAAAARARRQVVSAVAPRFVEELRALLREGGPER